MSLRKFLETLEKDGELLSIDDPVDPYLEATRIIASKDGGTVLLNNVKGSGYRVVGGVCGSRKNFARAFGAPEGAGLIEHIAKAIDDPVEPVKSGEGACQEVVEKEVDLTKIPILTHSSREMGPYVTAGVFIANDADYGTNMSFHRTCRIGKDKLVSRVCQRDLYTFLEKNGGELDIAICIGLHPAILLAAATSAGRGINELAIANALSPEPVRLVKCRTNEIYVPADAEIVLEGRITKERTGEGPFIDITGTYDYVREEPVIEIECVTHRKDPIYHAIIPALSEHKLLMGMPKEPVIYREVNKVCRCTNVSLSEGGCSWLHAFVQIEKKAADDGMKAIDAALNAHKSLKHVVVVDSDIDINEPGEVEWAIATRSQAGTGIITRKEKGSSLDPSAGPDNTTWKAGIDATIPWGKDASEFKKGVLGE